MPRRKTTPLSQSAGPKGDTEVLVDGVEESIEHSPPDGRHDAPALPSFRRIPSEALRRHAGLRHPESMRLGLVLRCESLEARPEGTGHDGY